MNRSYSALLFFLSTFYLPLAYSETIVEGKGSTFLVTYDPVYNEEAQTVMNAAALFWANTVSSSVPIKVDVQAVNISCTNGYTPHVQSTLPPAVINFENSPLVNTYFPISLANSIAGTDLQPTSADITIRFNKNMITRSTCLHWYMGYDANFDFSQVSLYFETLQEIAHGLGLISLGNLMTGEKLNGYNDVYWTKLKSLSDNKMLADMTKEEVVAATHQYNNLVFKGSKSWQSAVHLTFGRTDDGLLMFSRPFDALTATGLHLHESTKPLQLMSVTVYGDIPETDIAVSMLEDIGWRTTRNTAPVINGQEPINIKEDTAYAIKLDDLQVADDTPEALTLSVSQGEHYTLNGNTVQPDLNFYGQLTVPVTVNDGEYTSNSFNLTLTVSPVNDAPVITAQIPLTLLEDSSLTLSTDMITIHDVDSSHFTLEAFAGDNYELSGLTVQPSKHYAGTLTVPVIVHDGSTASARYLLAMTVTPVNDAPVIHSQNTLTTSEDQSFNLTLEDFHITDVESDQLTLIVLAGEHYSVSDNRITPAQDYAGELNVTVKVNDGSDDSNLFQAKVTVLDVNDPPVIEGQTQVTLQEDATLTLTTNLLNITDIDSTAFQLVASSGEHYQVSNNLLEPEANYVGALTVPVQVSDGSDVGNIWPLTITVTPVNDAPVIEHIVAQRIAEDSSLFIDETMMSIVDPDNSDFTLRIAQGEHYDVAGNEIIPHPNWFGELSIDITLNDGQADSNTMPLPLTVESVNDLPMITTESLPQGQIYRPWTTTITAEDIDSESLTFQLKSNSTWLTLTAEGELSGLPTENMIGDHPLEIAVTDGLATVSVPLTLSIQDDPTATDLSVSLNIERNLWATSGWVPVTLIVENNGPLDTVEANLTIQFSGEWTTQDSRCDVAENTCSLSVKEQDSLLISVRNTQASSADFTAKIHHNGFDIDESNNSAQTTLTFSNLKPLSPQYSVPAFGHGTVRAIGIADMQGGRWQEILFANGPSEASTLYRFDESFFNPVLHSHLADAADSYAMALFDIDNDGDTDWVLANGNGEANSVYRNDGNGFFELVDLLGHYDSRAVAFGDIDQDGDIDLVFANNQDPNTLYSNNGDGTFTLAREFPGRGSRGVIIFDFNWDGRPDILFANRGWLNHIYYHRGYRSRTATRSLLTSQKLSTSTTVVNDPINFDAIEFGDEHSLTEKVILADLNGDGIASDVVLVNSNDEAQAGSLQVFTINQDESSQLVSELSSGSIADISSGDYDGDGIDDVAVLRPSGVLEIMKANDHGSLDTIEIMDTDGADTILMIDVDGSGTADVISANNHGDQSNLSFTREVMNNQADSETTPSVTLPKKSSNGGAGLPWLLLPLLIWRCRK